MVGFILDHVRRGVGRSLALVAGVLVATTGFTVLTASTATSRLSVTGTLAQGSRAPYQIMVRPPGARTMVEQQRGLIRPNFQADTYGGITAAQWRQVRAIRDVEVAAPISMLGYTLTSVSVEFDLTDLVDPELTRQVLRVRPVWRADRGLTEAPDEVEGYVYITRRPVLWPPAPEPGAAEPPPAFPGAKPCGSGDPGPYEVAEDGRRVPLCVGYHTVPQTSSNRRAFDTVVQILPDGRYATWNSPASPRLLFTILAPVSLLVAAIDPDAEADLVGLDRAVVGGRYLTAADRLTEADVGGFPLVVAPALLTARANVDEEVGAMVERRTSIPADSPPTDLSTASLRKGEAERLPAVVGSSVEEAYQRVLRAEGAGYRRDIPVGGQLTELVQVGSPSYDLAGDGTLTPRAQPPAADSRPPDEQSGSWAVASPWLAADSGFRAARWQTLHDDDLQPWVYAGLAGVFDPAKIVSSDRLTSVPLETYAASQAGGADAASRDLLGGRPLLPSDNVGGYLATAPSVLISLRSWQEVLEQTPSPRADPISVIRVRVNGVTGYDGVSRERVRLVAEEIHRRTGLDVDVVLGSSPALQAVALGPGRFGRPELRLAEPWSKLNVATTVERAVDRKSALLFGLILVVCALFLGNAVAAAVRDRRRELAVLTCLGWPRRRIFAVLLGEVATLGLAAGVLAAVLSWPLGRLVGTSVSLAQLALAVPVAVVLAVLAGVGPAVSGSRTHPAAVLSRPAVRPRTRTAGRRGGPWRSIAGLALRNLRRTPGRAGLGALALGVSVCALTLLLVVQWTFDGAAVGTVLGDAVAVSVRGVDLVAVVIVVALGVLAVVDVLYLNIRDRAPEIAALHAVGWSAGTLGRLVAYDGLALGISGALLGAAAGVGAVAAFVGTNEQAVAALAPAALAALAGVALTVAASVVPALLLPRLVPISALLSEE
jgi:hypothetical protein